MPGPGARARAEQLYSELDHLTGLRPELARLTIARKIAAVTLAVWKSRASFEAGEVMKKAA